MASERLGGGQAKIKRMSSFNFARNEQYLAAAFLRISALADVLSHINRARKNAESAARNSKRCLLLLPPAKYIKQWRAEAAAT